MPRRSLDPKDYPPAGGVWTYEEYMKLPVENTRYEVIAGELYITPTPPTLHQAIAGPQYGIRGLARTGLRPPPQTLT